MSFTQMTKDAEGIVIGNSTDFYLEGYIFAFAFRSMFLIARNDIFVKVKRGTFSSHNTSYVFIDIRFSDNCPVFQKLSTWGIRGRQFKKGCYDKLCRRQ